MSAPRPNRKAPTKPSGPLNLDVLIDEADFAPFPFVLAGEDHELPHVQTLTGDQLISIEEGSARNVLTEIAGDLAPTLLALPAHALNSLIKGWRDHAGVKPGE